MKKYSLCIEGINRPLSVYGYQIEGDSLQLGLSEYDQFALLALLIEETYTTNDGYVFERIE